MIFSLNNQNNVIINFTVFGIICYLKISLKRESNEMESKGKTKITQFQNFLKTTHYLCYNRNNDCIYHICVQPAKNCLANYCSRNFLIQLLKNQCKTSKATNLKFKSKEPFRLNITKVTKKTCHFFYYNRSWYNLPFFILSNLLQKATQISLPIFSHSTNK